MRCNQCEALMINGVFCHETGCPNANARYDRESKTWVKQYECRECGCMQDVGEVCCGGEEE
jgi:ATP-dependent protease ClpP protease subunit